MTTPLLTTKLYIPPVRRNLVPRPRLIQRLNAGLTGQNGGFARKLTLISAPAGFGKTTLVSAWICDSEMPVRATWLSLDEGDNDPVLFFNYLIAALQQIDANVGRTVQQLLGSPQIPPPQSLVTSLINDITATGAPLTLVLDDYHTISSKAVHHSLQFLLKNQPPWMHVIVGTREDPPLLLPRLRARGQVTEIRERDLRFTPAEAAAFLQQTMGLTLAAEAVQALAARTEGWIVGLQLAALALQEDQDPARAQTLIADFTGDDRYIMDYLVTEVLQRLPEPLRDFLRQTAILDRLSASLCNAVTGRQDSQARLEQLESSNLFLIPLDRRREWYRYYHLFAEVLRTTLDREEQTLLHHRAARWYETHGFVSQAIGHALAYAAASADLAHAERLIRRAAEETLHNGGVVTVRGWLDALPDERVRASKELALYKGWALAFTGELGLAEDYATAAERCLRQAEEPDPDVDLGKLLLLRCYIALGRRDYEQVTRLAARALQVLKPDQSHWRVIGLWAMAEAQERTSSITAAIATLREAARTGRARGNQIFAVVVEMTLAAALNSHGQRQEAVAVCEAAIERYTDATGRLSPVTALVFSRLGMLCYEANQLELAHQYHERGLALGEQLALESLLMFSLGMAAPTLYARGDAGAALTALQRAHQLVTQEALADAAWLFAAEADIRMRQGDLPFALRWAETGGLSPDDAPQYLRIEQHLVFAHLLLAQGRLPDARRWLARLEVFAQERGLYRWLISVHILQALTAERSGKRATARERLARALQSAAPEGYYRAFLDADARILALLPQVRYVAPTFVDKLLDQAGLSTAGPEATPQPLIEPLSERELQVLRLIAAGLRNREIAQELFIATGTVKRHINHIYGKLQVHSRTEAVARARDLGLLW